MGSGETSLTVTGANFAEKAAAQFNGKPLETEFKSATELVAQLKPEHTATAGPAKLIVVNPPPGGASAPAELIVTSASAPPPLGDENKTDGCDVAITDVTPDEDLPAAEGGVA